MKKERMYDLDWLRVIAIFILLFFHTAMIYNGRRFHISHPDYSELMQSLCRHSHFWRMPLLLFISGAGTFFALRFRSRSAYAGERTKRLLIPLLFCIPIVVAPQVYIERIDQYSSFVEFFPHFFEGVYPSGNFSWHHLWFIVYLFIYSMILIPLFFFWRSRPHLNDKLVEILAKRGMMMSPALILVLSQIVLRPYFPEETHALYNDWAFFVYYGLFFVFGFILTSDARYRSLILAQRRQHLATSVICTAFLYGIVYGLAPIRNQLLVDINDLYNLNGMILTWAMVLTALGYGARYLNKPSAFLKQANEWVYPFYIWHQAVILVIGYNVLQWNWGVWPGFWFVSLASGVVSVALTWLVSLTNPTRRIFGMKPRPRKNAQTVDLPMGTVSQA